MPGWTDEVIRIQQQEDGSYIFEIVELDIIEPALTLSEARHRIVEILSNASKTDQHPARLSEIGAQVEVLQAQIEQLENEADRINTTINKPIQATELLEELPKLDTNLRLFEIDHPLEQHIGRPIVCIGIIMTEDRDDDGDLDIRPVLHTVRYIKV